MYLNEQTRLNINGVLQYVSIRAEKEGLPLLLYLHGGPGDAALPLVLRFNQQLENHFTVVVWEQRGAGKSFYPFGKEDISIDVFLDDLYALTSLLLERFHQDSLYLLGHSWGSVLGLRFITEHPGLIRTYIGCGQVVNMKKSCREAYEYALAHSKGKILEKLKRIDCSYSGGNWLQDLLFVTKQVVRHKGSLYGKRDYNDLMKPFLFCKYYSIPDLINRQKGSLQSIQRLWQELMQVDFENITSFQTPVAFIEGTHDHHVSSTLAKAYYDKLASPKQFVWFEESCHFPQWSEHAKFNALLPVMLDNTVRP